MKYTIDFGPVRVISGCLKFVVATLGRQRQEDHKFQDSLGYIVSLKPRLHS